MPGGKTTIKTIPLKPKSGEYITDGKGLWRVEFFLPDAEGVVLEDARSGNTEAWSIEDFAARQFRVVERSDS